MKSFVIGAKTTKFGELWSTSPRTLAKQAVQGALKDAGLKKSGVHAIYVGNMLSGMLGGQEHLGAFFADELNIAGAATKIEGACASGGLAVHQGVVAVESGLYDTVVVLGVEKMTDHKPEAVALALMGAGSDQERLSGATFPGLYAMLARAYMETYGATEEDFAAVSVKNHFHASMNPLAQFRREITVQDVLRSAKIADPLKLLDCSPISDGASAVVITSKASPAGVRIAASVVATDTLALCDRGSLTSLQATKDASSRAYEQAGCGPSDVDVCEVHDCFSIAEVLAMEDLGFYKKGTAAKAIARQETRLGGSGVLVNSSGGLKACGHPVGATGVKQVVEVVDQLLGRAGSRQQTNAHIGLTHNVGGSGATAVVHVFERYQKGES